LGLIAATVWFAAAVLNADVAIVAGLLLASSPGVFALARYAILDTLFTIFTFGGAMLLTVAALSDGRTADASRPGGRAFRRARLRELQWIGYVAIALGVLTKGPVALVLCGLTLLMTIAISAEARRRLLGLNWIAGLAVIVAIAAPWFVYMDVRFGRAFVDGYLL